jgi:ADP-ribose pyrophosphatase YjhB (NUDIX family)
VLMAKIVKKVLQQYWRQSRGLTLDVMGIILDDGNHVLLVRTADRPTWVLPTGPVKDGETVEDAVRRMLWSDLAITFEGPLSFIGLEPKRTSDRAGHFTVVAVRHRNQDAPSPRHPRIEVRQFHVTALPADLAPGVTPWISHVLRLAEHPLQ